MPASQFSVLMVCTGNICRSPTAEIVLRDKVRQAGLADQVHIASAGTTGYHAGSRADERSSHHARLRGYDLSDHRARQVRPLDFERFDLILGMDAGHMEQLEDDCPPQHRHKLRRFMAFAPEGLPADVADPYPAARRASRGCWTTSRPPATGCSPSCCPAQRPEYPSWALGFLVYLTETVRKPKRESNNGRAKPRPRGPAPSRSMGGDGLTGGCRGRCNSKPA